MASATPNTNHDSPQRPHASSSAATAASPPSKRDLKSWWKSFKSTPKQHAPETRAQPPRQPNGIFGVELRQSITYANVAISLIDENGKSYIYGYVPIVVAKCGVYLKEKATGVEGIFRLSGSEKRIKELKHIFDSPDRYGKGLVWDGYTVHDAATVLRRYLNDLPEPVVPLNLYDQFRAPLRGATRQAVGDSEGPQFVENFDEKGAIQIYQTLITELPPLNRQLLLYILDLLAVFAAKSDENRMNSQNLAAIFQPGTLSHPDHAMAPAEYRLNQCVIIFLIENQDHFLIGMHGTAADEQTKRAVEAGLNPEAPSTPTKRISGGIGRSASNASAGADSVRKDGKLRRNRSVSSRNSSSRNADESTTPTSPVSSATPPTSGGLGRSNTVPSKRSPALAGSKFRKADGTPSDRVEPMTQVRPTEELDTAAERSTPRITQSSDLPIVMEAAQAKAPQDPSRLRTEAASEEADTSTPTKERNLTSFFQKSPTDGPDKRQPNKLRKKQRIPGSLSPSAQSSNASLPQAHSNLASPSFEGANPIDAAAIKKNQEPPQTQQADVARHNAASPTNDLATHPLQLTPQVLATDTPTKEASEQTDQPKAPSTVSLHGGGEAETNKTPHRDSPSNSPEKKKHWNVLRSHKDDAKENTLHSNDDALASSTSINSGSAKPRKSLNGDGSEYGASGFDSESKDSRDDGRGPMSWIKHKYREHRNKSPTGEKERERVSLSEKLLGDHHHDNRQEDVTKEKTKSSEPETDVSRHVDPPETAQSESKPGPLPLIPVQSPITTEVPKASVQGDPQETTGTALSHDTSKEMIAQDVPTETQPETPKEASVEEQEEMPKETPQEVPEHSHPAPAPLNTHEEKPMEAQPKTLAEDGRNSDAGREENEVTRQDEDGTRG